MLGERDANFAVLLNFEWQDGSTTAMPAPKWLADLALTASTGQGVVWPKGARKALERTFDLYQRGVVGDPPRPEALAALRKFRDEVLPDFKEGNYLSPKQARSLLDFLSAQA